MTLYQFNLLEEKEQAEMLWDKGVHVAERGDEQHNIVLYQMEGFYVEVFYHREQNAIKRFRSFSGINQLEPYLSKIDIGILK
jgi:hypothetical protein